MAVETVLLQAVFWAAQWMKESGAMVDGSDSDPVEIEKFWTFTLLVGPNPWK